MSSEDQEWELNLYVGGKSPQSVKAIRNLRQMVSVHMDARAPTVNVLDVLEAPDLARSENILALPTLQRKSPLPATRIIGDLSDIDKVWVALNDG